MNWIIAVVFFLTLALGIPVAFCLALTSLIVLLFLGDVPLHLIPQRMFTGMDSFPLMAVPFFILAGDLMNNAGITKRIVRFATALVGSIRGGLAHVNIVASMFFAGISGSAVASQLPSGLKSSENRLWVSRRVSTGPRNSASRASRRASEVSLSSRLAIA